jgi:hypothetical protein
VERRRAAKRRRRRTTGIAAGVLLLILGVAGTLAAAGVIDVGLETFLAGAVVLTGLTVLVASFFGGAPLLVWLGLAFAGGVGVVAAADLDLNGGIGDRVYRPATAAEIKPKYELGIGRQWIDLRNTPLPMGTTTVDADLDIGDLVIVVPDGVRVDARARADAGEVHILDRDQDGTDVDDRLVEPLVNGRESGRTVRIDAEVGFGQVRVYRGAGSPQPEDGDE